MTRLHRRSGERGAALLLALLIMTLVATLAAGMVWQQQRAIAVEAAERARAQAGWVLAGALDFARFILKNNARSGPVDDPRHMVLKEARISSFLAADRDNSADTTLDAFIAGAITHPQGRYNLSNLLDAQGKPDEAQVAALQRLADAVGAGSGVAARIASGLAAAAAGDADAPLEPRRVEQLVWLGIDEAAVRALAPVATLLPRRGTTLNLNEAPASVIAAVVEGLPAGAAERLVERRQRALFQTLAEAQAVVGDQPVLDGAKVGVASTYFEVRTRLRLDDRVLEEISLVERSGTGGSARVDLLWRERHSPGAGP